ncbi:MULTISPECIES: ABC transporter permease [unclassified Lactobacillus]|uniref:ABC transporter permease n=1 Tax=unclassified Lactobacillus TaxID=2620435 RepID=UPI002269993A|nr:MULTISPECIES: ABC transporter permease [unclassified Lactobacillus]MCX8722160.1 ABC transporter permease [Lactobacillus sp. B4010]MCX8732184.1 ABC transporter permease [Lactobacillus sp. B4015]MCX8734621.1 ABC transporter permease [Lactobacillus sp. B4012]
MRTLAITKKVLIELFRDKRSLALMFLAPILVMWLMNVMFSANSKSEATIATVDVNQSITRKLRKIDGIDTVKYQDQKVAAKELKSHKVDAVIYYHDNKYDVTHANTDSGKTVLTKQALNAALTKDSFQILTSKLKKTQKMQAKLIKANPLLAKTLPRAPKNKKTSNVKIVNHYQYGNKDTGFFAKMVPILLGFFVFLFVFLISGMALLKERTSGTLDRLLATPVRRSEIVFGYMFGYGIISIAQATVIVLATIWLLNIEVVGNIFNVILISFLLALVALTFGLLLSTLAESEFQMQQLIPIVIVPQVFFSGLIPLDTMAYWVQYIGKVLPLTYTGDALTKIMLYGKGLSSTTGDILALLIFLVILIYLNVVGLKRYRKV